MMEKTTLFRNSIEYYGNIALEHGIKILILGLFLYLAYRIASKK